MNALIISLYLGYAIYKEFPFREEVIKMGGSAPADSLVAIGLYALAVALSWYLLKRLGMHSRTRQGLPAVMLGILVAGFLLVLCYQTFAITAVIPTLPTIMKDIFANEGYFFWWFIAPFVGLFLLA